MNLNEQIHDWNNLRLAYQNASRGKRGRGAWRFVEQQSKQRPLCIP